MINKVLTVKQVEQVIASASALRELPEIVVLVLHLLRAGLSAKGVAELTVGSVTDGHGGIARTIRAGHGGSN